MGQKLVLYHRNCVDGWVAAVMAVRYLGTKDVVYKPIQYEESLPDFTAYDQVYILDFSVFPVPPNAIMLDHHATAMKQLGRPNDELFYKATGPMLPTGFRQLIIVDMTKSGARLAKEHFDVPHHWIIDYAEDHDLWKFKLPDSHEIRAGLRLLPRRDIHTDAPIWLAADFSITRIAGKTALAYQQIMVEIIASTALNLIIHIGDSDFYCMMVNSGTLISEVGQHICQQRGIRTACMWFQISHDKAVVSVRGQDARKIAEAFGGGGHDEAAGFQITGDQIQQLFRGRLHN